MKIINRAAEKDQLINYILPRLQRWVIKIIVFIFFQDNIEFTGLLIIKWNSEAFKAEWDKFLLRVMKKSSTHKCYSKINAKKISCSYWFE